MIDFNKPPYTGNEDKYVIQAMQSNKLSGDGYYGKACQDWFEKQLNCKRALLTPSCTSALEMAAMLINVQPGDEIIMPSYTFVSTANAFVLRGANIVFIDVHPGTMNMNESLIVNAISDKTKAIVPVHYAGVACEMDRIMEIAVQYQLYVIEDAAQGMMSTYNGRMLGTIGHFGAYSFHETKNYTSGGEGGLLIINDENFIELAEIIREKGTNRSKFFRGQVDKYTWVNMGSSYLPSELQCAFLWGQLEKKDEILENRMSTWNIYYAGLKELQDRALVVLPHVPDYCKQNAHMFFLKVEGDFSRDELIRYLLKRNIKAVFHYIPLHTSPGGKRHGYFKGADNYTSLESQKLVRLPLYYGMKKSEAYTVISEVKNYFEYS